MSRFCRRLDLVSYFRPCTYGYGVLLHVHEDHERRTGGRSYREEPAKVQLKASIVPLDENLKLRLEGESSMGYSELYVDTDELYRNYGLEIDIQKDYIEFDGKLYKLIDVIDYGIYTNVTIYLIDKLPDDINA